VTSTTSRVQVISVPIAAPGVCVLCGTSGGDNRTFIDFGKQLDWYGAIYFCNICIAEISRAIGFVPVDDFNELYSDLRKLKIDHEKLKANYVVIKNALANMLNDHPDNTSDDNVPSVPSDVESEAVIETNSESAAGDTTANEPDSVERLDDILDVAELESD
jgi:hypothetical protein